MGMNKDDIQSNWTQQDQEELDELSKHPYLQGDGRYICSDGTDVSYRTSTKNIRIRMMHLSEEELDDVIDMSREYHRVKGKLMILNRKRKNMYIFLHNQQWQEVLDKRQEALMELFGRLYNAKEVHYIITEEWGYDNIPESKVAEFQRRNSDQIAKLRDAYQKDFSSIRLVHKKSRLDELTQLYQSRKIQYGRRETKTDYDLLLKTLEQIRKEVEGEKLTIAGHIKHEHELVIQSHVSREVMKYLNINDIIIGRLCARLGVDTKYILSRLHNSYYKKFTGFLPEQMDDNAEVVYPSSFVYDFNRMKELHSERVEEKKLLQDTREEVSGASVIKQKLISMISQKKSDIDKMNNYMKGID